MENIKIQLQEDITGLMKQVTYERELKGWKEKQIDGMIHLVGDSTSETKETKNYSEYRKLVHSLFDNIDTYFKLNNGFTDDYINEFSSEISKEIQIVRVLMIDSQVEKRNEQYRCLNSVYLMLIEGLKKFEDRKPREIRSYTSMGDSEGKIIEAVRKCTCSECHRELPVTSHNFYTDRKTGELSTLMCKSCAKKYILKSEGHLIDYLKKMDAPYIRSIWNQSKNDLGEYMSKLNFSNNRGTTFKDSKFI
jgi:hypothetical protein